MFDFITIDFETANEELNSACQIGLSVVKDLEIVDYFMSYIRPPCDRYSESNIKIHGITPDVTERSPTLNELWPDISSYFSEHIPVIAHNAHFDMSVLRLSTDANIPNFTYIDSISILSPFVPPPLSLSHCTEVFGVEMEHHHDALSDAMAVAKLLIAVLSDNGCISMWELLAKADWIKQKRFFELNPQKTFGQYKKNKHYHNTNSVVYPSYTRPNNIVPSSEINPENRLYGKNLVFTGELSFSRETAYQIAVNCGATIKSSVSRKVDYLVVGTQDKSIVGDDGLSSKQEKAIELNNTGKANIQTINEEEFLSMAKGKEITDGSDVILTIS